MSAEARARMFCPARLAFGYNRRMRNPRRKISFALASSDHDSMIVNQLDDRMTDQHSDVVAAFTTPLAM
jgi:hypothetical protein